jgi:hypothetical protein
MGLAAFNRMRREQSRLAIEEVGASKPIAEESAVTGAKEAGEEGGATEKKKTRKPRRK